MTDLFLKGVRTLKRATRRNGAWTCSTRPRREAFLQVSSIDEETLGADGITNGILQQIASETDNNVTLNNGDRARAASNGADADKTVFMCSQQMLLAPRLYAPPNSPQHKPSGAFVFVEEGASKNQGFVATMVATKQAGAFVEQIVLTLNLPVQRCSVDQGKMASKGMQKLNFDASIITSAVNFP